MLDLTGKVALVTGASEGVGRTIALDLARAGADIVVNFAHSRSDADRTATRIADLGRRVAEVQAELTQPDDIEAMVEWIEETFGRLDIIVSNVAPAPSASLLGASLSEFDSVMHGQVRPLILLTKAARPLMSRSGSPAKVIALLPSLGAEAGVRGLEATGRAALTNAVRWLSEELQGERVNVNAVQASSSTGCEAGVSSAVAFFASSLSDQVHGQLLTIGSGSLIPA